jgi:hydrogenase-1 operon protein HyaF
MIVFDATGTNGASADVAKVVVAALPEAILTELAVLLERFAETGEKAAIDLAGLPLTVEDKRRLEQRLGRGEVKAVLSVIGCSEVWETAYAGVWWVRHRGADDRIAAEELVVTSVPDILSSHQEDVRLAAQRLRSLLDGGGSKPGNEEAAHGD